MNTNKTEDQCKRDLRELVPRLAKEKDIKWVRDIARKKRLLSKQQYDENTERPCANQSQRWISLFSAIGEIRSLLVLCIFFRESNDTESELGKVVTRIFDKLEKGMKSVQRASDELYVEDIFTSNEYELANLYLVMNENGEQGMTEKILQKIEENWREVENLENIDSTDKQRLADMCVAAAFVASNNYQDYTKLLTKTAYLAIQYTTDKDKSKKLLELSEFLRWAYDRDTVDRVFPEDFKQYSFDKNEDLFLGANIHATRAVFLISKLKQRYSSELHRQIIQELEQAQCIFASTQEDEDMECFRINLLMELKCMEALCRLGISFQLENITNANVDQDAMEAAKVCLISIILPPVWKTLRRRWKIMTYVAICKWFHLNDEIEKADHCAENARSLSKQSNLFQQLTEDDNVLGVFKGICNPGSSLPTFDIPEMSHDPSIEYMRLSCDTLIVRTKASEDKSGPFDGARFQHILSLKKATSETTETASEGDVTHRLRSLDVFNKDSNGTKLLEKALRSGDSKSMKESARKICDEFRTEMHQTQECLIYEAWIGYIPDNGMKLENLRVVALYESRSKRQPSVQEFMGILVFWKQRYEVNEEAKRTISQEDIKINSKHEISGEEAEKLFNQHSNLNIIHSSSFRSTHFFSVHRRIIDEPSVALYCQVKGIIPFGERAFPIEINGLKTDVREGYVIFGAGKKLKPGMKVQCLSSEKCGLIGGFVELVDSSIAFITAGHVVAKDFELRNENAKKALFKSKVKFTTVPSHENPNDAIGIVIKGTFWNADPNESSVDAALVRTDRVLVDPAEHKQATQECTNDSFSECKKNDWLTTEEVQQIPRNDVLKYGAETSLTTGELAIGEAHVKICSNDLVAVGMGTNQHFRLFKQMGVRGVNDETFFALGDSGAFFCMSDKHNELKPFGMAIGVSSSGFCIVTPIDQVFKKLDLNIPDLKLFPVCKQNLNENKNTGDEKAEIMEKLIDIQNYIKSNSENTPTTITKQITSVQQDIKCMNVKITNKNADST